jgi:hypothetical protein
MRGVFFRLIVALSLAVASVGSLAAQAGATNENSDTDPLLLKTAVDLALQYTYRSSDQFVEPYQYKNGIDIMRDYLDVPPLAQINVDIGRRQGLSMGVGLVLRRELNPDTDQGYFYPTNFPQLGLPGKPVALDNYAFTRGVIYWRSPGLDLSIGRDKVDYGEELRGSLYPSDRLPFFDAFRMRGKEGPFQLDWMVATLYGGKNWEAYYGDNSYDVDPNASLNPPVPLDPDPYGFEDDANPSTIIEEFHRLSWDFEKLRVGIAENYILARRDNHFLFTDFVPLVSWHQTGIVPNNITVLGDITWTPSSNFTVSAQGGLDAFNVNGIGIENATIPTIPALVVGAHYEDEDSTGAMDAYVEAGYTHYLWGNFSAAQQGDGGGGDGDPLERAIYRLDMVGGSILLPMSSPYGPGAIWLLLSGGQEFGYSGIRVGAEILLLLKNTEANLVNTPYQEDSSVIGAPEEFFGSFAFPVRYRAGSFDLTLAPDICVRSGTWWFEAAFTVAYHFRRATPLATL